MLVTITQTLGALVLLYLGGEALILGASTLAARLGVSALAIGLTVVAFGTSMPELVVSLDAALYGASDIAVGNVVGSNIANISLILGVAALVRPIRVDSKILLIDVPIMIFVSLALVAAFADGVASRLEGSLFLSGLVGYTVFTFWEARRESRKVQSEFASAVPAPRVSLRSATMFVFVGLALLVVGGDMLVTAATTLSGLLGMSQAAIGLSIVAVGTSLPEFVTSVIAAARGHADIAIGNVLGSNIFNILGILGLTAAIQPLAIGAIAWLDLGMLAGVACLLSLLLFIRSRLAWPEGALLLAGFVFYMSFRLGA